MKEPWETPLSEYIGVKYVVEAHISVEQDGPRNLMKSCCNREDWEDVPVPERPDVRFLTNTRGLIAAIDPVSGDLFGGFAGFYPYVLPQHRGRNLNAEMNVIMDNFGQRSRASSYSHPGFGSRVATHRLHIERALASGHEIPDEVMKDYSVVEGKPRLRQPYTAEMHNAWTSAAIKQDLLARHALETQDYLDVFQRPEDLLDDDFSRYDARSGGYLLAIALHRHTGAEFLVHNQGARVTVQAEFGDIVVDSIGIRSADMAVDDLCRRELLRGARDIEDPFFGRIPSGPITVSRYQDEEALLEALSAQIEDMQLPDFSEEAVERIADTIPWQRILQSDLVAAPALTQKEPCEAPGF